jgi:hypothetical protein
MARPASSQKGALKTRLKTRLKIIPSKSAKWLELVIYIKIKTK